jgi:hypothetical protein
VTRTALCRSAIVFRNTEVKLRGCVVRDLIALILATFAAVTVTCSIANAAFGADDETAIQLGRKVLSVRKAIQNPQAPNAMQAVTELGRDQRYYVMVRGWLSYQLQADLSILETANEQTRGEVKARIHFLKEAIRAIDLE